MAKPHGFTVATIPDANASAERSVDHELDAELVGEQRAQLVGGELPGVR